MEEQQAVPNAPLDSSDSKLDQTQLLVTENGEPTALPHNIRSPRTPRQSMPSRRHSSTMLQDMASERSWKQRGTIPGGDGTSEIQGLKRRVFSSANIVDACPEASSQVRKLRELDFDTLWSDSPASPTTDSKPHQADHPPPSPSLSPVKDLIRRTRSEGYEAVERGLLAALKGFSIGAGLRGGVALVGLVMKLARQRPGRGQAGSKGGGRGGGGGVGVEVGTRLGSPPGSLPAATSAATTVAMMMGEGLAGVIAEAVKYGVFVGSFAGTYCLVDEGVAVVGGRKRTAAWRSLLAGAAAAPSLVLAGPGVRHTSLVLYLLVRALVLAARCGINSKAWGHLFKPLTWQHGDVLLMCLSASEILTTWALHPEAIAASYRSFLDKQGAVPPAVLRGLRELFFSGQLSPALQRTLLRDHRPHRLPLYEPRWRLDGRQICDMMHPGKSCEQNFLSFLPPSYLRTLPVYAPVYIVPALLVHRANLLHQPATIALKTLLGIARSALFLSMYCGTAWYSLCTFDRVCGQFSLPMFRASCAMPGLAVLIEKKSRRMELALYCLSRAIESFLSVHFAALRASPSSSFSLNAPIPSLTTPQPAHRPHAGTHASRQSPSASAMMHPGRHGAGHAGFFDAFRRSSTVTQSVLDVCILGLAAGIIMHCYANERAVFRSKYLNVLDWVFGVPRGCEFGGGREEDHGQEKRKPGQVRNVTSELVTPRAAEPASQPVVVE